MSRGVVGDIAAMTLALHEFHEGLNARFAEVNGCEVVNDYGDWLAEHTALRSAAGVMDLSFRSRICLTGADRVRLLNGQVTNDVKRLQAGEGCYAALVTAKGKLQSDLNIFALADELLLDFEPGFSAAIAERLEKYIIADDVQVVDASSAYGLLSVQGPKAETVVRGVGLTADIPAKAMGFATIKDATLGEIYLANHARTGSAGFDLFAPVGSLGAVMDKLIAAAKEIGGRACGWQALETARIEAGVPRFGADMDETNLAPEAGIEARAISYSKGCYIGQEVIARVRTYGQVTKALRGLKLPDDLKSLPARGDKLFHDGKEVGYVTSAATSPVLKNIALGYVRKEVNQIGTKLTVRAVDGELAAEIVETPFR
ncbi:MAG TPA: aminomethyltransferase family protein [Verrucomicrobiae bacterium]|nr:aminomethyltransferase family protein [Verrucomicrobiae bacterium]